MSELLTANDQATLREICRLHDRAFERYQQCDGAAWKSSEGAVTVYLGNVWERQESTPISVSVYSYALGPNRNHFFATLDEALREVRKWHDDAFEHVCGEYC